MTDPRVKVLVFVDDLRLLSHEMENSEEVFAFGDEFLGLFDELGAVGLFVFELFVKLLLFLEFVGQILSPSHCFVSDFNEAFFE